MLAVDAARRWKDTWTRSWPAADVDAIAALYAPSATYCALAFRGPRQGTDDIRGHLRENFNAESGVRCRFGEPIVAGSGAAIDGGRHGSRMAPS
jgi:ketosteroid isomerase-like protein